MADGTVRFVRCPKCENVLPELPDYSVYRCGGCGTVLRAKIIKSEVDDTPLDKPDGERVGGVSEKFDSFGEEGIASVASEANITPNDSCSFRCDERSSENDDVRNNPEKCANVSKCTVDKWVVENDFNVNMNRDELGFADMGMDVAEMNPRVKNASESQRSRVMADRKFRDERVGIEQLQRAPRADVEKSRFPSKNHLDEGSSIPHSCSGYSYGEPLKNRDNPDAPNRVECLKQDRADLLRKLDELKDQLSRSCDVTEKQMEKVPQDRMMLHQESCGGVGAWFPERSSGLDRASMPFCVPDKRVTEPLCFNQYHEPQPFVNRPPDMAAHGFYPSTHTSNRVPVYGDPYGSQMLKRPPPPMPCHYQQQPPPHMYFSGQYVNTNLDQYAPYPSNAILHQSSCSCLHCYGEHREVGPVPPTAFHNKRILNVPNPNNPMLYHHEKPTAFDPRVRNPKSVNPLLNSCNPHVSCLSGINPDTASFAHCRPGMVVLADAGSHCLPMAGGAPFITCHKCFELLQVPKKVLLMEKNQRKVRCGGCSAITILAMANKKIVVTPQVDTKQDPSNIDGGSNPVVKATSHSRGHLNQGCLNFYSDDSGYEFQSMDKEPVSSSIGQGFDLGNSQGMQSNHSSSLNTSGDEDIPDGIISPREATNSAKLSVEAISSPPLPGSPLQDQFDHSNNHAVNRCVKGNRSTRSDQEKVIPNKTTSRQNSLKDIPLATEMEVSSNEYRNNTGTSQGSADVSRDPPRIIKGSDSFFASIIKKSFRDFSRSNQKVDRGKMNVTVNGHPIPERAAKKAEKLAGPIHPGQYWYDSRAGFWGVMGGPCLGIIPPFIEEFNYPMTEDCAGGNTGIYVNGRELHQKDLDLLASRGLPTDRDRSYIIEIFGTVLDEDSGEELDGLGKLAPTVEKVRHGFGMKTPKAAR